MNNKHMRHVNMMQEQRKLSKYAFFCTLNYDNLSVPKLLFTEDRTGLYDSDGLYVDLSNVTDVPTLDWLSKKKYIEYVRYSDFQLFMKRFRQNVRRMMPYDEALGQFQKYGNYEKILYYCASEYGPYTARPHFHCIIYFSSDWLASVFGKVFYKSWSEFDRSTTQRHIKGIRSQYRPCSGDADSYTAAYCDRPANIPSIFQVNELKPRCSYSKFPLLGVGEVNREKVCQFQYGGFIRQYAGIDKQGNPLIYRYPRSFENKYLPKCVAFGQLTSRGRMQSYGIAAVARTFIDGDFNYITFKEWCYSETAQEIFKSYPLDLQNRLFEQFNTKRPFYGFWLASLKFFSQCRLLGCSLFDFLSLIENYYSVKSYYKLRDFYEFAEVYSQSHDWRELYSCHRCDTSPGFNVPSFETTSDYKSMVIESTDIQNRGIKSKKDRDYQLRGNAVVFNP